MFLGKLYPLFLGAMLFFVGTLFSYASGFATVPCARLASLPSAGIAFNPCTIFDALSKIGFLMQMLGIAIAAIMVIVIVKTRPKQAAKCPNCKAALPEKSSYCPKCGAKLSGEKESQKPNQ